MALQARGVSNPNLAGAEASIATPSRDRDGGRGVACRRPKALPSIGAVRSSSFEGLQGDRHRPRHGHRGGLAEASKAHRLLHAKSLRHWPKQTQRWIFRGLGSRWRHGLHLGGKRGVGRGPRCEASFPYRPIRGCPPPGWGGLLFRCAGRPHRKGRAEGARPRPRSTSKATTMAPKEDGHGTHPFGRVPCARCRETDGETVPSGPWRTA
jgi:hypothetical protein